MDSPGRLLIVANRLPLAVTQGIDGPTIQQSAGGLATGLRAPHEQGDGLWFGWTGTMTGMRAPQRQRALELMRERRFVPIELSREEVEGYYNEFSNGVLWPTFHYQIERFPMEAPDWRTYVAINERFADEVAARWRPGDRIWVHDFHLMLLPQMLRDRLPQALIGFFLHIPFPSSEVFRVLPWRKQLLSGLLGADLIGFHTLSYLRHFSSSLLRVLGVEVAIDRVELPRHRARLCAMPMGIDVATFERLAADEKVQHEAAALRRQSGQAKVMLGIDRLDYTKGIPRRLLAFERLLEMRGRESPPAQLVQVAVTSRDNVNEYKRHKRAVDEMVGRINGRFGAPDYTPIRYVNSNLDAAEVAALYKACDVLLVTPVRDGLNLVAKEFVATRTDDDGVLVLSEFAGATDELPEALKMNPYDVDGTVEVLAAALALPLQERSRRMRAMRQAVRANDVHDWVRNFLGKLDAESAAHGEAPGTQEQLLAALATARDKGPLSLFLDYDGTLVDFAPRPELATPDAELLAVLRELGEHREFDVHVVSGRPREFLDEWFGALPVSLHGEHGLVSRAAGSSAWISQPTGNVLWHSRALELMQRFTAQIPGAIVERKAMSIALHYRQVDPEHAQHLIPELRVHLAEMLGPFGANVISGNKVLEVRPVAINKGLIVSRVMGNEGARSTALVIGDDRTDEDMFAAAPAGALTVHVGNENSLARYRLAGRAEVRAVLVALLEHAGAAG